MLGIDIIWWFMGGLIAALGVCGYCTLVFGARIGDDINRIAGPQSTDGTSFLPPEETSRPEHDAAAERVYNEYKAMENLRQVMEVIAHFTACPWTEHVARTAWANPEDMVVIEEAISMPTHRGRQKPEPKDPADLVKIPGKALTVSDPYGKVKDYVLTVEQRVVYEHPETLKVAHGVISAFFEDPDTQEMSTYAAVHNSNDGRKHHVPTKKVRPQGWNPPV